MTVVYGEGVVGKALSKIQTQGQIDIEELQLQVSALLLLITELADKIENLESKDKQ